GPYAADVAAASVSTLALVGFLRVWKPAPGEVVQAMGAAPNLESTVSRTVELALPGAQTNASTEPEKPTPLDLKATFGAWLPWLCLSLVMGLWSYLKLFPKGRVIIPVPGLHNS